MVAVVDVRMPGGGVEAIQAIRQVSPQTAIVVYTAYADPVTEREMRAAGAFALVAKGDRRAGIVQAIWAAAETTRDDPRITSEPGGTPSFPSIRAISEDNP